MPNVYTNLAITILVFAAGCASNRQLAEHTEFKTRITDTGLKHFQLSLARSRNDMRVNAMKNMQRPPPPQQQPRRPPGRAQEKQLIKILENKLTENQFCREGHWIIDKSFIRAKTFIRGECNENATATDRANFPNTLTYW